MTSLRKSFSLAGLTIFIISFIVFFFSAERTGSLWDCGEFILGAYKLQVVHPPGAPIFILIGRVFTWIAEILSDNTSDIAFAVNIMSGICTSIAGVLAGWITMMFGKIALVGKEEDTNSEENLALLFTGIVAGLATTFASSIWFSAVEGEVYAMSTMFTALTFWAATKWYYLPDTKDNDRWLVFSLFSAGLSIGVHLLSLLAFPSIALLYYFKKFKKNTVLGGIISLIAGLGMIAFINKVIIVGIPTLWKNFDIFMVNSLGAPVHSGLIPTILLISGLTYLLLRYAHQHDKYLLQLLTVASILITIAFSTIGTVVIRANADTPVNMNVPSEATSLLPYLNREQYGERPFIRGPHYLAKPIDVDKKERYGLVNGQYEIVNERFSYQYANKDKILFPRIGHTESNRPQLHKIWKEKLEGSASGRPGMGYNLKFLFKYQLDWMYWRYFMWNFVGKQNGNQGYYPWNKKDGNWLSGIGFIDEAKLYNMEKLPDDMENNKARNVYYFLPLIFGLLGLLFHYSRSRKEFFALLILFIITGIGIIFYTNQPPNEPRERDYIFVGSFMVFSMWIGMGVLYLYKLFEQRLKLKNYIPAILAGVLVLSAPILMGFQNFDDIGRKDHLAALHYPTNFLESVAPNAILFTYGDNDTYPLWYAQEVEGIRKDVRVVNLSLIAVDWYINKLRKKVNDSPPIRLSLSEQAIRGKNRNQVFFYDPSRPSDKVMKKPTPLLSGLKYIGNPKNNIEGQTIINTKQFFIPIDDNKWRAINWTSEIDSFQYEKAIQLNFAKNKSYITKDELAIMDIIASNINDRPIYFATTCRNDKLLGLNDYMQLEGLALRLIPIHTKSSNNQSIYGSGKVDTDILYDNVMNKWQWGNFDKEELFVDKNYMPAIQMMQLALIRGATEFIKAKKFDKAADLANKFFEGFPHFNFPYDFSVIPVIRILVQASQHEDAKKHLRILADQCDQYMQFYESLSNADFSQFEREKGFTLNAIRDILGLSNMVEDTEFRSDMENLLGGYVKQK